MPEFVKECDVNQGYNYTASIQSTFGYLNTFVLGNSKVAADIRVVDPTSAVVVTAPGGRLAPTDGTFAKPVVAVLSGVRWSTLPTDKITLQARISAANASQINALTMQSLSKVVVMVAFVVYQYDPVEQKYFTCLKSYKGEMPSGAPLSSGGSGFGADIDAVPIYALVGKTSGTEFGLKVSAAAEEDPIGIRNHTLDLVLAPPVASSPQQILMQTSFKTKLIKSWGLPQS